MPKLTIVTPTLNCRSTLLQTLESVRPLCARGAAHIVVDSGSTDGTIDLAKESGVEIKTFPKGNMYAAINAGMEGNDAEWLTYINGDDLLYADAVIDALDGVSSSVDVIYGNIDYIDDVGRFLFSWRSPAPSRLWRIMAAYSAVPQQGTLFRRRVLDRLGGFDTNFRYSADYDFWARALAAGFRFERYSRKTLAAFRLMPTQLSQAKKDEMAPEGKKIRARLASGRTSFSRMLNRGVAAAFRVAKNVDNYWLRASRGRGLDRR
jgi:glycosyltransferase